LPFAYGQIARPHLWRELHSANCLAWDSAQRHSPGKQSIRSAFVLLLGILCVATTDGKTSQGIYTVTPPEPKHGHWTGYYVEVFFKSALKSDFLFTTPGYTWPDTLPFPPCVSKACVGRLL